MFRNIRSGRPSVSSDPNDKPEITDKMRTRWKIREFGFRIAEGTASKDGLIPAIKIARKAGLSPDEVADAVVEGQTHYEIAHSRKERR